MAPPTRRCCCCCLGVLVFLLKFYVYRMWVKAMMIKGMWSQWDFQTTCDGPEKPANHSGVKVLLAGYAKMGTRTMSRTLWELGMNRSYHSEEFLTHVWSQHATDFWHREQGFEPWCTGKAGVFDQHVLKHTSLQELARMIAKCQTDALAFDGIEKVFWPMYEVSPGAKVIVLDWRTFNQTKKSLFHFSWKSMSLNIIQTLVDSGFHALPYLLLFHLAEPLFGEPAQTLLRTGYPPMNQRLTHYTMLYIKAVGTQRFYSHMHCGLSAWGENFDELDEEKFNAFFAEVRRRVPAENRLHFNPGKNTYDDLCRFLGVDPCPKTGRLPRAIDVGNLEIDHHPVYFHLFFVYLFIHWLNWKIFGVILTATVRKPLVYLDLWPLRCPMPWQQAAALVALVAWWLQDDVLPLVVTA